MSKADPSAEEQDNTQCASGDPTTETSRYSRRMLFFVGAAIVVVDQVSKYLVRASDTLDTEPVVIIPGLLRILEIRNPGGAWGLGGDAPVILAVLSLLVFGAICLYFHRLTQGVGIKRIAFSAILGGIMGNLIDRVWLGAVVDFIDVYLKSVFSWPVFNVADCAITVGVMLFLGSEIFAAFKRGRD